ncbi:MAG: hypothetical protein ACI39R_01865 [Lachnospiraceae bacterium]
MSKKSFLIAVFISCISLCACNYGEVKIDKATDSTARKIYVTPTNAPAPGTSGQITTSLDVCGQEGIILLMASYYTAMESGDTTAIMSLVTNPDRISESHFSKYGNITDVDVKRVYTLEGTGVVDTIAYVYYEIKIDGFETPVPSLDELFISYDNGAYYIYNGKIPSSEYNELVKLTDSEGVKQLVTSINREFMSVIDSDEALKEYLDSLDTGS